jgi:hypothetical protein
MNRHLVGCFFWLLGSLVLARADDFLDRVDEALTFSAFEDRARVRFSGALDLEYYHISDPPFGLVNSSASDLFNPRLSLFVDSQLGPAIYLFAQARVDRGFDPSADGIRMRLDEYALRITPWEDGRLSVQIGKFAPVIGNWMSRHLSWDNPFVTAPLPYEHLTNVSDLEPPRATYAVTYPRSAGVVYEYLPIIWNAAYATGMSVSGRLGKFEYAAEIKNAALSSRPDSWDATHIGFEHPTFSARLGWRPSLAWNLGVSASRGPYLRPEAQPLLPRGSDIGEFDQIVVGQDISFAWRHLQLWAEVYAARFEVPRVGDADTIAFYLEAKYKFTPAFFAALRWNQQFFGDVPNGYGRDVRWGKDVWRADAAAAYRFTAHTQLKVQYSLETAPYSSDLGHMVAVQFTVRF